MITCEYKHAVYMYDCYNCEKHTCIDRLFIYLHIYLMMHIVSKGRGQPI